MVEDIQYSSAWIGDRLIANDCLIEDKSKTIRLLNHKDPIRNTVRFIKGRLYKVLRKFVKCLERIHPEVSEKIWKTFEVKRKSFVRDRMCVYCKLRRSIDIIYIADHVWTIGGISDSVYADIVSHTNYNVMNDSEWDRIAEACNKSENNKILKNKYECS